MTYRVETKHKNGDATVVFVEADHFGLALREASDFYLDTTVSVEVTEMPKRVLAEATPPLEDEGTYEDGIGTLKYALEHIEAAREMLQGVVTISDVPEEGSG